MPFSTLARTLGITESRARRTVVGLLDSGLLRPHSGLLRPRVEVDPRDLGYAVEAVLSIGCRPGAVKRLAASPADHPATRFLALTAASSAFTHGGVFRDEEHLADFLTGGFEGSEEVTSLECSLQLEVVQEVLDGPRLTDGVVRARDRAGRLMHSGDPVHFGHRPHPSARAGKALWKGANRPVCNRPAASTHGPGTLPRLLRPGATGVPDVTQQHDGDGPLGVSRVFRTAAERIGATIDPDVPGDADRR